MKKSIATILSSVLLITFSGCEGKNFNLPTLDMPDVSIPSFDLSKKQLDRSLPRVEDLKIVSSLSQVALEWKPIRNRQIEGYRILRSDGKGGFKLIQVINDPYVSHYTDENLHQSRYNRYLVSAYTSDGRVSLPTAINVPKNSKKIEAVPFVTAVSGLPNRIKILWRIHPDLRVNGYIIQKENMQTKKWESIATVEKRLSVEYMDDAVRPGNTYHYRVFAKTADGVLSKPSKVVSGSSKPLPAPVTGIMATTNLPKKIEIIWKASDAVDSAQYRVYASDFADGIFSLIAKTKATHYTDRFDQDGATRFYRITVVDKDGLESPQQAKPTRGSTLGYLKAPKITSARIVNSSVELRWAKTDPRTVSYTIYKKFWDGWKAKKIKIVGFKGETFVDHKIKPDITYTYSVIAVDKNGIASEESRSVNLKVESMTKKSSWF